MDPRHLAKKAGCIRNVCNNRESGFQWCTNYSCSYGRRSDYLPRPNKSPKTKRQCGDEKNTGKQPPKMMSMIDRQRAAQKLVMERLKTKWENDVKTEIDDKRKQEASELQNRPACWQEDPTSADGMFPEFELLPSNPKRYPPRSAADDEENKNCAMKEKTVCPKCKSSRYEHDDAACACGCQKRPPPRDFLEPRFWCTQSRKWKGVPIPFQTSEYELLVPGSIDSAYLFPAVDPFVYVGRRGRGPPKRCSSLQDIPPVMKRREVFGHSISVEPTTSSLGYRPQRKHPHLPPTFLWI